MEPKTNSAPMFSPAFKGFLIIAGLMGACVVCVSPGGEESTPGEARRASRAKEKRTSAVPSLRTNGEYLTVGGYVAATTSEKLKRVNALAAQGDRVAFGALIEADPEIVIMEDGLNVFVSEYAVFQGMARIRLKGTTHEVWVSASALRPLEEERLPAAVR